MPGRQTAFPNILVEEILARNESKGRGVEFDEGLPENIPTERIESLISSVRVFGSDRPESKLVYKLQVMALTESSAKAYARAFVRLKNPFEPDIVGTEVVETLGTGGVLDRRNRYRIEVTVEK